MRIATLLYVIIPLQVLCKKLSLLHNEFQGKMSDEEDFRMLSYHNRPSEVYWQRSTISLPTTMRLKGNLEPGHFLLIHGKTHSNPQSWPQINLVSELDENTASMKEVPLHVVLNLNSKRYDVAFYKSGWHTKCFFSIDMNAGDPFEARIRVLENGFETYYNGQFVCFMAHQVPIENIKYLRLAGDYSVDKVVWTGSLYNIPYIGYFFAGSFRINERIVMHVISKGSWKLVLLGRSGAVVVYFNGKQGQMYSPSDDQLVVKEVEIPYSFENQRVYELTVQNEKRSIQVYLNDYHVGGSAHSTSHSGEGYTQLEIDGDVDIVDLDIE